MSNSVSAAPSSPRPCSCAASARSGTTRRCRSGRCGDADGRIGDVDVLTAGTARPVRVDAQILLVDADVDVVGQLRPDVERGERRVPARRLIERRDAHQPVDAGFGRKQAVGVLAETVSVALLMPASSPACASSSSRLKPRRSAQRRYMRRIISAQSCDSVPPAPGCTVMIAFLASCSPPSIFLISPASTSPWSASRPRTRSPLTSSPASNHSRRTTRSSVRWRSDFSSVTSSSRRRRRCSTCCAAAWLFQKSGALACASRRASSCSGERRQRYLPSSTARRCRSSNRL